MSEQQGNPVVIPVQVGYVQKYMTETDTDTDDQKQSKKRLNFTKFQASDEFKAKLRTFKSRTITSVMLISGFFLIITMGHLYAAVLILALTFLMYKELIALKRNEYKDKKNIFQWLEWYLFGAFAYLMIPNIFLRRVLVKEAIENGTLLHAIMYDYHFLISFALFMFGILLFVWSLEKGTYKYQFQRFSWSMLALIFVFCIPAYISYNIYKGIFWFLFPQLCVITNDTCACIVGFWFGKTPLTKLSPKKTVEGFIGGMACTFLLAFTITDLLSTTPFMVCPQTQLTFAIFENLDCDIPLIFTKRSFNLPIPVLGFRQLFMSPAQIHSLVIATFACLIAPFGGYFASAVKRAFRIKDFGDTIPGHGGITDRLDCHGLMGIFIYCYLTQVVYRSADSFEKVMDYVNQMSEDDKAQLLSILKSAV